MTMNTDLPITIESKPRPMRPGPFTGHKHSPNQSLSARINNLARSTYSKASHLAEELNNFELWAVDNLPEEMYRDTYYLRAEHHRISVLLDRLSQNLREYNNTKPVYVIPSSQKTST